MEWLIWNEIKHEGLEWKFWNIESQNESNIKLQGQKCNLVKYKEKKKTKNVKAVW